MIDQLLDEAGKAAGAQPFIMASDGVVTFGEAAATVARLAGTLKRMGLRRFGIQAQDSAQLVQLICAAARAGSEICVINNEYEPSSVVELMNRFDLEQVVADRHPVTADAATLVIQQLFSLSIGPVEPVEPPSPDPEIIILTTGTTGQPKGARYRWASLVAQARIKPELRGTRWLLAYHLNHFAGIQVLTHVLANRATIVVPSTPAIADAVEAIVRHEVEYVSATPTFWRVAITQLGLEAARRLPLKQITLGGEAVSQDLLELLRNHFPRARVSQVFATTEAGSCFSVRDRSNGIPASILEAPDARGVRVRIVDGELQVLNPNGMLGYYGSDDAPSNSGWRPTGDLVELRGDRIFFVGRSSETINVGGVKVHPIPIEEIVQKVPGVAAVRCYGRKNPITGQIVALDVQPVPNTDTEYLEEKIRRSCESLSRASQPRLIRFVDALDMANRKILRRQE